MRLMQTVNITIDDSIQDLVKKLADGSLILYDLHRYRLYVPEQPLKIMELRNTGKTENIIDYNEYTYFIQTNKIIIYQYSLIYLLIYHNAIHSICFSRQLIFYYT